MHSACTTQPLVSVARGTASPACTMRNAIPYGTEAEHASRVHPCHSAAAYRAAVSPPASAFFEIEGHFCLTRGYQHTDQQIHHYMRIRERAASRSDHISVSPIGEHGVLARIAL